MTPVLSVRGLEKRFGAVVAADALTLDIAAGQKVSLIGANGAGKTTFVNMVTGYLKPDSGSIALDGNGYRQALAAQRGAARHLPFVPDSAIVHRAHRGRKPGGGGLGRASRKRFRFIRRRRHTAVATRRSNCWSGSARRDWPTARSRSLQAACAS